MDQYEGYKAKAEQLIEMIKPLPDSELRNKFSTINPEGSNKEEVTAELF
jgi:hypothetical protein